MLRKIIGREKNVQIDSFYNKNFSYKKISIEEFFKGKRKIFIILPEDSIVLFGLIPIYRFLKMFYSSENVYALLNEKFADFRNLIPEFDDIFLFSDIALSTGRGFEKIKNYIMDSDLVINFLESTRWPEILASYSKLSINFNGENLKYFNINYKVNNLNLEKSILDFFIKEKIIPFIFYKFKKNDVYNIINFLYENGYKKSKVLISLNYKDKLNEEKVNNNYFLNLVRNLISNNKTFLLINIDNEDLRSKFYMEFSKFDYNVLFVNKLGIKEQVILSALSSYSIFNFSYYYLLSSLYCRNSILLTDSEDLKDKLMQFSYFKDRKIVGYENFLFKNFF